MQMHINVYCDFESRGNTFSPEGEFSDRTKCFHLTCSFQGVSFSSDNDSLHSYLCLGDLTKMLEEENRSLKNTLLF